MTQSENNHEFLCLRSGAPVNLPFDEAHRGLWAANMGWVVPIRWYRWKLSKHEDQLYFDDREIHKAEEDFAFILHSRRCSPVIMEDLFDPERSRSKNPKNPLTARASRFGSAVFCKLGKEYKALLPYEPVEIPAYRKVRRYGYQMKRGVTWFVVVERDGVPEHAKLDFDWTLFLTPPGRAGRGGHVA